MERLKVNVVMLPKEKARSNWGENEILLFSPNIGTKELTFPNAMEGLEPQDLIPQILYFASNRKPVKGELVMWNSGNKDVTRWVIEPYQPGSYREIYKIEAVSDKNIGFGYLIPHSFVNKYILQFNNFYRKRDGVTGIIEKVNIDMDWIENFVGNEKGKLYFPKTRHDNTVVVSKVKDTLTIAEAKQMAKDFAVDMMNLHYGKGEMSFQERVDSNIDIWTDNKII